jgi:hypothetical protein
MTQPNLTQTFEPLSYGLGYPQPYPFGIPEELPRNATSPALAAAWRAFSGSGRVIGGTVTNTKNATQFLLVFDVVAAPITGAVPVFAKSMAASDAQGFSFPVTGRWFSEGCWLANSSTQSSLTPGSADCLFDVQYVPQVI